MSCDAKEIAALSPLYQNISLLCFALLPVAKKVVCSKLKLQHLVCKMSRNFLACQSICKRISHPFYRASAQFCINDGLSV